jgi:phage recombination protein Bet
MKMSEVATIPQTKSVVADMANKFGMEREAFERVIMATVMPSKVEVSKEQFVAFLSVAKEYNLNPLTREIFAFPSKTGGIQPIVSIDGWLNIINQHPQCDGYEFVDNKDDKGNVTSIECRMYRKDRSRPVTVTEYLKECTQSSSTWQKWPIRMLRHKALIQAARYAFGFSGIIDEDEAQRMVDVSPSHQARPNAGFNKAIMDAENNQEQQSLNDLLAKAQQTPAVKQSLTPDQTTQPIVITHVGITDTQESEIVAAPSHALSLDAAISPQVEHPHEEPSLPLKDSIFPGDINVN